MAFLNAFSSVASLLSLVALGFLLARLGWFPEPCAKLLPRLVTNVALPPYLALTIISHLRFDEARSLLFGAALPLLAMILLFAGAWILAKIIRVPPSRTGVFCASVSNPNTIFIGVPVNQALFGPSSLPYVLIYYFASTIFFWTVGNYFISRDSPGASLKLRWQNIVSPPIMGFIAGVVSLSLDVRWPAFVLTPAGMIGDLTTPLALLFVGVVLAKSGRISLSRDLICAATGRLIISPLLLWLLLPFFHLPKLMGNVFVIQAALPVVLQVSILSAYYNADARFGSEMVALTTVACAFTAPLAMCLL